MKMSAGESEKLQWVVLFLLADAQCIHSNNLVQTVALKWRGFRIEWGIGSLDLSIKACKHSQLFLLLYLLLTWAF